MRGSARGAGGPPPVALDYLLAEIWKACWRAGRSPHGGVIAPKLALAAALRGEPDQARTSAQDNNPAVAGVMDRMTRDMPGRVGSIDAIRGYAILAVVAVHCTEAARPESQNFLNVLLNGSRGVQLFYMASAFSMFLVLSREPIEDLSDLRRFFVRRFVRLAPMYWLAITIYLPLYGAGGYWSPNGVHWPDILMNMLMIHTWWPEAANSVVPGGWSVGVEMTFYVLVPALVCLVRNVWMAAVLLAVAALGAYPLSEFVFGVYRGEGSSAPASLIWMFAHGISFPPQMPAFAAGILLFFMYRPGFRLPWLISVPVILTSLGAMLFVSTDRGYYFDAWGTTWTFTDLTLFTLAMLPAVAAVILCPALPLNNAVSRYIGKISYSIYLLHIVVMTTLNRGLGTLFGISVPQGNDAVYVMYTLSVIAICVALGSLTYALIEQPGIRAARRWARYPKNSVCPPMRNASQTSRRGQFPGVIP